ncbi:MAG: CBS domain-containing protein [Candidatus Dormibacteraceae bacterium]
MAQTVKDVMTSDPVTVDRKDSVAEAARLMREHDVGAIVVEDQGKVCGIVTDRDITVRAVAAGQEGGRTNVGDICSAELGTVSPGESLDRAIEEMRSRSVRRVPVTDDGGVVGILSIGDLAMERDQQSALADISAAPPNR